MGAPRRWAAAVLRAAVGLAPEQTRGWATAMLRELDFIKGDWSALFWALGGVAAILRHASTAWRARLIKKTKETAMSTTGKKTLIIAMGALCLLGLAGCAFPMLLLVPDLFPSLKHAWWPLPAVAIAIPVILIGFAGGFLWRKRGPVAAGVLLVALAVGFHVAVHLTMHR
jgi:hypothetical protein